MNGQEVKYLVDKKEIIDAIKRERAYQDKRHGTIQERPKNITGWWLIMECEFQEALRAWNKSHSNDDSLRELLQVAAVAWACLEQHSPVLLVEAQYQIVSGGFTFNNGSFFMGVENYDDALVGIKKSISVAEQLLTAGDRFRFLEFVKDICSIIIETISVHGLFEREGVGSNGQ